MSNKLYILNGPNLNLLGEREPQYYGHDTLADIEALCKSAADRHGFELNFRQTNAEHQMIDWLQEARHSAGIVINPSSFCYNHIPVLDTMRICKCPVIEVHIANIYRHHAEWRSQTMLAQGSTAMITGCGANSYVLGIEQVAYLRSRASA